MYNLKKQAKKVSPSSILFFLILNQKRYGNLKKLKQIDKELASMAMQVNGAKTNVIDENVSLESTTTQNSLLRCDRFCTIL